MKKIISALILVALLLSSILAIVPIAAEEAEEERTSILINSQPDQYNGLGPAFFFDYPLYIHDINYFPLDEAPRPDGGTGYQGKRPYMLRSRNAAGGSSSIIDGSLTSWSTANAYLGFDPTDELNAVTDHEGNEYLFDAWVGISLRETKTIDSFRYYTLNEATQGGRLRVEELTIFGAVVNPETHTYDVGSWFKMADTFTDVQANYTDDGQLAVVEGDLYMPFAVDYIFLAFMIQGEGGGEYTNVELEVFEYTGGNINIDDLETTALFESIELAEAELAKEGVYTTSSYATLLDAYNKAIEVSTTATNQQMVDYAVSTLQKAYMGLEELADTTELQALIDQYAAAVETDYTTSSWATLATARDAAVELISSGNASETAVAEHIMALSAAGDALAIKASATVIATLKVKIGEVSALDEDLYTAKSLSDLRVSLRDANAIVKDEALPDVSEARAQEVLAAFEAAFAALQKKADINAFQEILDEVLALSAKAYTSASFAPLQAAIDAAQTFLAGTTNNATEEEANALIADITAAKEGLVALGDFSAVDAKLAELDALVSGDYTAESWKALKDAIDAANALKSGEATQADVDAALTAINAAADALVKPTATEPAVEEPKPGESGCGGIVGVSAVVIVASLGLGAVALKRKEN